MKALIASLICWLTTLSSFAAGDQPGSITLERTECYGTCPSYVLTVLANGSVTFEGRTFVKSKGFFTKKIDAAKVASLFKMVEDIHFWTLKDIYEEPITDLPTKYVTVKTLKRSKRVEDYAGSPPGLQELERLIDEVAGVSEWVGASKR